MLTNERLFENISWYLGCGMFHNNNYVILARDDDFSKTELQFVEGLLQKRGMEYILDKDQIKIKNDKSN